MADLAEVWSWTPATMDPMPLPDLIAWRAEAAARREKDA